jgi:phage shock protein A
MSIMTRVVRILRADIHGVIDQLEDKGLLLKQYLRDMETALLQKEERLKSLMNSRSQVQKDYDKYRLEAEKLEQDLTLAIEKDRDDIARMLIKKLRPLASLRDERGHHLETIQQEIANSKNSVEEKRLQYEKLKHRSSEYFHRAEQQEWETELPTSMPHIFSSDLSEEEVELELIHRKEAVKGGFAT